jgi:hypothetical protein
VEVTLVTGFRVDYYMGFRWLQSECCNICEGGFLRYDWGNVPSNVSAGLAIIVAVRAWLSERRAKRSATAAKEQAERAAAAAEESAVAARDAANAQQRLASIAEAEAAKYPIPWRIYPGGGMKYWLRNESDNIEYAVSISGPLVRPGGSPTGPQDVHGRSQFEFMANQVWQVQDESEKLVTVTWHHLEDHSDTLRPWKSTLPRQT